MFPDRDRSFSLKRFSITFEQWCYLRGYTQAIEYLLRDLLLNHVAPPEGTLAEFLSSVPIAVEAQAEELDLDPATVAWFSSRWKQDVWRATQLVAGEARSKRDLSRLSPVARWAKK